MDKNSNINKIVLAIIVAAVVFLYVLQFTKSDKVAYIDTSKLLEKSNEMAALKKILEKDQQVVKSNLDTLTNEFQNSLKEFEKNQHNMSAKERVLNQELLRSKQQQLIQYQQAVQQKVQGEEQKKSQTILNNINAKIKEFGEKNNYKIIFATAGGNIAFGNQENDITEQIIEVINK